jgi:hypothetical protein
MTASPGLLANLGHQLSDQTVGNILGRHDIEPAQNESQTTTWKDFIRRHMDVRAGSDFFTVEVLSWRGLGGAITRQTSPPVCDPSRTSRGFQADRRSWYSNPPQAGHSV